MTHSSTHDNRRRPQDRSRGRRSGHSGSGSHTDTTHHSKPHDASPVRNRSAQRPPPVPGTTKPADQQSVRDTLRKCRLQHDAKGGSASRRDARSAHSGGSAREFNAKQVLPAISREGSQVEPADDDDSDLNETETQPRPPVTTTQAHRQRRPRSKPHPPRARQSQILIRIAPLFFKMAQNLDLRCVLVPAPWVLGPKHVSNPE